MSREGGIIFEIYAIAAIFILIGMATAFCYIFNDVDYIAMGYIIVSVISIILVLYMLRNLTYEIRMNGGLWRK